MLLEIRVLLTTVILMAVAETVSSATSANRIKNYARGLIRSTKWSYAGSHFTGQNTNKCNIFVADVLKETDADAPNRWPFIYTPIGAREWRDPDSSHLKAARCWKLCYGNIQEGDVLAEGEPAHVGIVTGNRKTTSATDTAVVENNWGFRSGQTPTCWRYQYTKSRC